MRSPYAVASLVAAGSLLALAAAGTAFELWHHRVSEAHAARHKVVAEVSGILRASYEREKKAPGRLEDLEPYAAEFPDGYREIKDRNWAVQWGTPMRAGLGPYANGDRVLARQAATDPGLDPVVIFGDGIWFPANERLLGEITEASVVLHQIAEMYSAYSGRHGRPPEATEDLRPFAKDNPKGFEAVADGRWVVLWGTRASGDAQEDARTVLAFDRKVLAGLGFILSADGVGNRAGREDLPDQVEGRQVAREIARAYAAASKDRKTPPAKLKDLEPYSGQYPAGYRALKEGEWIVNWGTPVGGTKDNGRRLLAFDRRAPITTQFPARHWVLLTDTSAVALTASEFGGARLEWDRVWRFRLD